MANSITSLNDISNLLLPGAMGIINNYDLYMNEWKQIFTVVQSNKNVESYIEVQAINGASRFADGSQISLASMRQAFVTYGENYNYGVGFIITANALEDNLYPDQFPKGMLGIRENLQTFQEYQAIAIFDNAFVSNNNPDYILGDGKTLVDTAHPISNGVVSNKLQAAQLSLTSYQELIKLVQRFKDYSGQPRKILPTHLLVGIDDQFYAAVVTGSQYDPGLPAGSVYPGNSNAINPVVQGDYIRGKYVLSHFYTGSGYFLLTDYKDGLVMQRRKSLEIQMTTDQSNRNLSVYGNERYRFVVPNFRCVAGGSVLA